jgi:hypothetical protein
MVPSLFSHPTPASVGVTFGATAIIHAVLVCTLILETRNKSTGDPYFVTYVFWTTFFFCFLVFFLGVCVRMTIAHANVLLELRRHGTRRLLQARGGFRCKQAQPLSIANMSTMMQFHRTDSLFVSSWLSGLFLDVFQASVKTLCSINRILFLTPAF